MRMTVKPGHGPAYRVFASCLLLLLLAGCENRDAAGGSDNPGPAAGQSAAIVSIEDRLALGKTVYERRCASCHEAGADGAPQTGDKSSWSTRSPLWMAVLAEHAKSGYFEMPSKGGNESLSDEAVAAATEYMLSETFPELPRSDY